MIVTRMQLYCDGDHGIEIHYPDNGAVDGAMFTAAELRREARHVAGWARIKGCDLCADCARSERKSKGHRNG